MKKFEKPQIEVIKITTNDIITVSGGGYQSLNYGNGDNHIGVGVGSTTGSDIFK